MSLASTLKGVIATASKTVAPLQENVTHRTWTGRSGFSGQTTVDVIRRALVEQRLMQHRLDDGRMVQCKAKLTILDVVAANGAADRIEPIDPKDKFILADGSVADVIDVQGMRNPEAGEPFLLEVWLG